jgi:signal transduction histidine kinase
MISTTNEDKEEKEEGNKSILGFSAVTPVICSCRYPEEEVIFFRDYKQQEEEEEEEETKDPQQKQGSMTIIDADTIISDDACTGNINSDEVQESYDNNYNYLKYVNDDDEDDDDDDDNNDNDITNDSIVSLLPSSPPASSYVKFNAPESSCLDIAAATAAISPIRTPLIVDPLSRRSTKFPSPSISKKRTRKRNNNTMLRYFKEATEIVPFEYKSDLAKFYIRRPYGIVNNTPSSSSSSSSQQQSEIIFNNSNNEKEVYNKRSRASSSQTIEVAVTIIADNTLLLLYDKAGVRCKINTNTKNDDENNKKKKNDDWKVIPNIDDLDTPLGFVTYDNIDENDKEEEVEEEGGRQNNVVEYYSLDEIIEQSMVIREQYCSTILSTAFDLEQRDYRKQQQKLVQQVTTTPNASLSSPSSPPPSLVESSIISSSTPTKQHYPYNNRNRTTLYSYSDNDNDNNVEEEEIVIDPSSSTILVGRKLDFDNDDHVKSPTSLLHSNRQADEEEEASTSILSISASSISLSLSPSPTAVPNNQLFRRRDRVTNYQQRQRKKQSLSKKQRKRRRFYRFCVVFGSFVGLIFLATKLMTYYSHREAGPMKLMKELSSRYRIDFNLMKFPITGTTQQQHKSLLEQQQQLQQNNVELTTEKQDEPVDVALVGELRHQVDSLAVRLEAEQDQRHKLEDIIHELESKLLSIRQEHENNNNIESQNNNATTSYDAVVVPTNAINNNQQQQRIVEASAAAHQKNRSNEFQQQRWQQQQQPIRGETEANLTECLDLTIMDEGTSSSKIKIQSMQNVLLNGAMTKKGPILPKLFKQMKKWSSPMFEIVGKRFDKVVAAFPMQSAKFSMLKGDWKEEFSHKVSSFVQSMPTFVNSTKLVTRRLGTELNKSTDKVLKHGLEGSEIIFREVKKNADDVSLAGIGKLDRANESIHLISDFALSKLESIGKHAFVSANNWKKTRSQQVDLVNTGYHKAISKAIVSFRRIFRKHTSRA